MRFTLNPFFSDDSNQGLKFSAQNIHPIVTMLCGFVCALFSEVFNCLSLRIASENIARSDETDAAAD